MSYLEADLLSSQDKAFIRDLFPSGGIYASLFSKEARSVIGEVGQQTRGVERMLRRIGFEYDDRIDPFDGGPHFVARTERVTLIKSSKIARFSGPLLRPLRDCRMLVAVRSTKPPYFHAVLAEYGKLEDNSLALPEVVGNHLRLQAGDEVLVLPLAVRRKRSQPPR
jgi:arginine N-succinyltransferase